MIRVKTLRQTCGACPSQWEGRTDDGRHVYIRYRWGALRVGVGDTIEDAVAAGRYPDTGGAEVYAQQLGDGMDGCISLADVAAATAGVLDLTAVPQDAPEPER